MSSTTAPAASAQDVARSTADAASARSGVRIELAENLDQVAVAFSVVDEVWHPRPDDRPVSVGLLRALTHAGNYCSVALSDDRPVGVSIAFLGNTPGPLLHSHITGVVPGAAGRNIGRALKLDQRAWALERGIDLVTWTYDPLIRRNAYFNANRLGALPSTYLVDFYGEMTDAINVGQHTDRLAVSWQLRSPAVRAICDDGQPPAAPSTGALVLAVDDRTGRPSRRGEPDASGVCRVQVPPDIERMRSEDPQRAAEWRLAVREVLGGLLADGGRVGAFTASGEYVVEGSREERTSS